MDSSLALDSSGNPHIGYYNKTEGDLKYAVKSGGTWSFETVDSAGDVGGYSSLALDSFDNPSISYYDATNGDLKYAFSSATLPPPVGVPEFSVGYLVMLPVALALILLWSRRAKREKSIMQMK